MIELLLCSTLTVLPDYLYRRFAQGKRLGREITLYSVWYELRWGITSCLILTLALITLVFYNHPATTSVVSYFRTVPIMIEGSGRVSDVFIGYNTDVKAGDKLFKIDSSEEEAAVETARRRIEETDAAMAVAEKDLAAAESKVAEAQSLYQQAVDELATKSELFRRNASTVSEREIERLQNVVDGRVAGVGTAESNKQSIEAQISSVLPAQRASAEAALQQAEVALDKTVVHAQFTGRVEQFTLRPGDFVNPISRPAGILIPAEAGRLGFQAGFGQIEAQIMKVGMIAEMACVSKPFRVIPMVVTKVQDYVAAGQVRPTDQLLEPANLGKPGTILVTLEPLFAGQTDDIPPGSSCIANAYSNNHDALQDPNISTFRWASLHVIDTVAVVHALILRIKALVMPIQTLVFAGH